MNKIDVVKSYWAAEGSKDLAGVLKHFAENASFRAPGVQLDGRENIRQFYEGVINNYRQVEVKPTHWLEQGDEIAVEYRFVLTGHRGEVKEGCGFNLFTIRDDVFVSAHCYFNPDDF